MIVLLQVPSGMGTAMRDKVVEGTVRLLCDMGKMPTRRPLEEPDVKVGMEAKVERVVQLLTKQNNMVLLHGMGGIGKTTLAKAVFNQLHADHPTVPCCFLSLDPGTTFGNITHKQQQLLKELTHVETGTLNDAMDGRRMVAEKLAGKTVLFVVDNVWDDRLEFLLPKDFMQLLGAGSMVLVTSREQGAARELQGSIEEEMECLPDEQSMELFCMYAFPGLAPVPSSWDKHVEQPWWASQIKQVLKMCAGLPMALEVVGRYFAACGNKDEFLNGLRKACSKVKAGRLEAERSLFGALGLSWSILELSEKEALLDIALVLKSAPWDWVRHYCGESDLDRLRGLGLVKQQQHVQPEFLSEYSVFTKVQVAVHDTVAFFCADADAIDGLPQRQPLSTSSKVQHVRRPASKGGKLLGLLGHGHFCWPDTTP
jgi:hypothetical protein